MDSHRWRGRVALITGASVGLGAAVAKHFAAKLGLHVIGCGRNLEKLSELGDSINSSIESSSSSSSTTPGTTPKGTFTPVQCDVRHEQSVLNVFELIRAKHGRLDVCVNNAGLAIPSPIITGDTDAWRLMLDVNVLALSIVARETIRLMRNAQVTEGHLFNIGSLSGHRLPIESGPEMHFYSATKFAVRALTEALRRELRQEGLSIRVTLVSPGIVEPASVPSINTAINFSSSSSSSSTTTTSPSSSSSSNFSTNKHIDTDEKNVENNEMKCQKSSNGGGNGNGDDHNDVDAIREQLYGATLQPLQVAQLAQVIGQTLIQPAPVEISDLIIRPTAQVS